MKTFLIERRKKSHLTMKEVAEKAGISESHYCLLENGERRPSVETAKRIGEVLGFAWARFFEEE